MIDLNKEIIEQIESIAVVGLGYVGIPIAVAFSEYIRVIGFDINKCKVQMYKNGNDVTKEVGNEKLKNSNILFTSDGSKLKDAGFIIVAVPTPINEDKTPNLVPIKDASTVVGQNMKKGTIVVYESTVYPGTTEEVCIPILERESGLCCGRDFKVGYSPERVNPQDKKHSLENIIKIVSGMDDETLEAVSKIYQLIIKAGVYKASSIRVAEAAKVIENSQRDINIAFMNELALIFHSLNIDTAEVLQAAATKWNFISFKPGLVGGHCIGVDPYYLTYKATLAGYNPQVILSGRKINDGMGKYIGEQLVKTLIQADVSIKGAKVGILGFTFKENCQDTRNTKVIDIIRELREFGIKVLVTDPVADSKEVKVEYDIEIVDFEKMKQVDAIVVCVSHKEYKYYKPNRFISMFKTSVHIIFDIKGIYNKREFVEQGFQYWSL